MILIILIALTGIPTIPTIYNYYHVKDSIVEVYPEYINSTVKYKLNSLSCELNIMYKYNYENVEYYGSKDYQKSCSEIKDTVQHLNTTILEPVYISKYNPKYSVVDNSTLLETAEIINAVALTMFGTSPLTCYLIMNTLCNTY